MNQDSVLIEREGALATLWFNRGEAMNTYTRDMAEAMLETTEQLRMDDSVRAVILRGKGPAFMAGGDLGNFKQQRETMPKGVLGMVRRLSASILNLQQMDKPVLAAVHGAVAGAGLSVMLAADMVVACEGTKFTTAYSAIGTSPDGGMSYFLPRLVGEKKACELMMLADRFDVQQAQDLQLINRWVEQGRFEDEIASLAHRLANGPTQAYIKIKRLLKSGQELSLAAQMEEEAKYFIASTISEDFKEGVDAFLAKRRPSFKGE